MSVTVEKHAILMSLQPLFEEAEGKGLWFFHESGEVGEMWCSPEHLRLKQSRGEYVWAPEHWELRNPTGYLNSLRAQAENIVQEYNDLARRLDRESTMELIEVQNAP